MNFHNFDFSQYEIVDIKDLDKVSFFHYTNINNLESIFHKGLIPSIGDNATGIEITEKVFFTVGITNSLILMESWLRWLIAKSATDFPGKRLDKPIYSFATFVLKYRIF